MKLLIAEDDLFFRRLLNEVLGGEYETTLCADGLQACTALRGTQAPPIAILDWVMPEMSGPQVCRAVRETQGLKQPYLIILTARNSAADVTSGLRAGADDYVTKPFHADELRARVHAGARLIQLQDALDAQTAAWQAACEREHRLANLLPICPRCHRLKSDIEYWRELDSHLERHASTIPLCHSCAKPTRQAARAAACGEVR
jgi:DNA-binding response OmpR family regulator